MRAEHKTGVTREDSFTRISATMTIVSGVSFVTCGLLAFVWVRSLYYSDEVGRTTEDLVAPSLQLDTQISVFSSGGFVGLWLRRDTLSLVQSRSPSPALSPPAFFHRCEAPGIYGPYPYWGLQQMREAFVHRFGSFVLVREDARYPGMRRWQRAIVAPCWFPLILAAVLPTRWLLRYKLKRHGEPGHCARCGYDLRASPHRCPECGLTPTEGGRLKGGRLKGT
jgi:hypothetical protein